MNKKLDKFCKISKIILFFELAILKIIPKISNKSKVKWLPKLIYYEPFVPKLSKDDVFFDDDPFPIKECGRNFIVDYILNKEIYAIFG